MVTELKGIEDLLASRIGLDPAAVGSHLIWRAARQRMSALGLNELVAYEGRLRESEPEVEAIIDEVVVAESWFFRDERPFRWFQKYLRARKPNGSPRPPVRILSLGSAGGEEPYSIAIEFLNLGFPAQQFKIDAVDVSARQLAIARQGIYTENAFRGPDHSFRIAHFRKHPEGYELAPAIQAMVQFHQASVIDPRLLEDSPSYDVVFCRNLLIYLSCSARAQALVTISRLLKTDGVLVIGHADRLDRFGSEGAEGQFTAVGDPGCFTHQRISSIDAGAQAALGELHQAQASASLPTCAVTPLISSAHADASAHTNANPVLQTAAPSAPNYSEVTAHRDNGAQLLDQATDLANQERFKEAVMTCERHLRHKGPTAAVYYLMGMICQAAGNYRRAEACLQRGVYLDPMHGDALLALALLAERRGDRATAAGFRRRAERSVIAAGK